MELSKRREKVLTKTILDDGPSEEDKFIITYYPNKITGEYRDRCDAASGEKDELKMYECLMEVVKEWNLTDNKKPVPVKPESFKFFDIDLLKITMTKLFEGESKNSNESSTMSSPENDED
jgi:hypothetical protein